MEKYQTIDSQYIIRKKNNVLSGREKILFLQRDIDIIGAVQSLKPDEKCIVISGSCDRTFPKQVDLRVTPTLHGDLLKILFNIESSAIKSWYTENLDTRGIHKLYPIPRGITATAYSGTIRVINRYPNKNRINKCLSINRIRNGPQWEARRKVSDLTSGPWESFFYSPSNEVPLKKIRSLLTKYRFLICVEGGGLDPSPKAFEALIYGCIPIIRNSHVADAYRHLPVLIVSGRLMICHKIFVMSHTL